MRERKVGKEGGKEGTGREKGGRKEGRERKESRKFSVQQTSAYSSSSCPKGFTTPMRSSSVQTASDIHKENSRDSFPKGCREVPFQLCFMKQ